MPKSNMCEFWGNIRLQLQAEKDPPTNPIHSNRHFSWLYDSDYDSDCDSGSDLGMPASEIPSKACAGFVRRPQKVKQAEGSNFRRANRSASVGGISCHCT